MPRIWRRLLAVATLLWCFTARLRDLAFSFFLHLLAKMIFRGAHCVRSRITIISHGRRCCAILVSSSVVRLLQLRAHMLHLPQSEQKNFLLVVFRLSCSCGHVLHIHFHFVIIFCRFICHSQPLSLVPCLAVFRCFSFRVPNLPPLLHALV